MRGVSDELARKATPQAYGASGRATAPPASSHATVDGQSRACERRVDACRNASSVRVRAARQPPETDMDSSFTIKPRAGVQQVHAARSACRCARSRPNSTAAKTRRRGERRRSGDADATRAASTTMRRTTWWPIPESREVIYRENDVRTHATEPSIPTRRCCGFAPTGPARRRARYPRPPTNPTPTSKPECPCPPMPAAARQAARRCRAPSSRRWSCITRGGSPRPSALYSAVLAVRPDHFDALQMLGVIKLARGDLAAALRLIGAAMQLRPNSPQVLLNHGLVLNAMKRHEEALASFDEALKHKSRFAEALNNRGSVLIALEPHRRGARQLQARDRASSPTMPRRSTTRAMRCGCSTATPMRSRASTARSRCGRTTPRRTATAARCSKRSAGRPRRLRATTGRWRSSPNFPEAMLNRCGALRALKRYRRGAADASIALLAAHPDYAEAHYMRGMLLADFNRAERGGGELRAGGRAQARLQQGALGVVHARRCRSSTPTKPRSAGSAPNTSGGCARSAPTTRPAASPGDMSKGLGMAQPFFLAYQGRNDRDLQSLFGALASQDHGGAPRRGGACRAARSRASRSASASSAASSFSTRCGRSASGAGSRSSTSSASSCSATHQLQAGRRDRDRQGALPPLRAGPALGRELAPDHPGRPAARAASIPRSA